MVEKGFFVVFEGIDGSGTSTHVHQLEERLEGLDKYQDVLRTHEPWKNKKIKEQLTSDSESFSGGLEMAELYVSDRADHTRQLIRPILETGTLVLCSRYKMSTCAYQWTQGVQLHHLLSIHEHRGIINPDLTFFLDIPREVAEERIKERKSDLEKFEKNPMFVDKLIDAYQALVQMAQVDSKILGPVILINGNRSMKKVADEIFSEFLEKYRPS